MRVDRSSCSLVKICQSVKLMTILNLPNNSTEFKLSAPKITAYYIYYFASAKWNLAALDVVGYDVAANLLLTNNLGCMKELCENLFTPLFERVGQETGVTKMASVWLKTWKSLSKSYKNANFFIWMTLSQQGCQNRLVFAWLWILYKNLVICRELMLMSINSCSVLVFATLLFEKNMSWNKATGFKGKSKIKIVTIPSIWW